MTYEKIFSDIEKNFKKAKIGDFTGEFAFQFNITGEGEGIFYAAYKNGILEIQPYDYKDRDVIFTADGKTLIDIAAGKLEPITAINEGKLSVDGNQELAKELMLLINHEKKTAAKTAAPKKETAKTEVKETKAVKEEKTAASAEVKAAEEVKAEPAAEKAPQTAAKAAPKAAAKPAAKAPAKAKSKKSKKK